MVLGSMQKKLCFQKIFNIFSKLFILILGSILLTIILKVFCFASFKVPSGLMEPTLKTGDYILVNKMIFGPRIFKDWKFWENGNWEMKRWKGLRAIRRNEILVFNFPITNNNRSKIEMDFNAHYVKRCVGIPGDTFYKKISWLIAKLFVVIYLYFENWLVNKNKGIKVGCAVAGFLLRVKKQK